MGNNGSSSRDQQAASVCSNGLTVPDGVNRGWSQSFPRELTRHRSQPTAARKVLPEPPNQRLRATDNGSIIQNGGTISGRRAPTFASSRDLTKRTNDPSFRERSGSASNLVQPCSRRIDRHCCRYRADSSRPDANTSAGNLKKFGSEPDLRCSPDLVYPPTPGRSDLSSNSIDRQETVPPSSSCYRYGKESKERLESAYKPRKKYKAPAPPASPASPSLHGDSSRDVDSRFYPHAHFHSHPHSHAHQVERHHHRSQVQPPPRRSRLFKTRAESKKAQITWQLSPSSDCDRERSRPTQRDAPNHWNGAPRPSRTTQHSDNDEVVADAVPVNRHDRDRPNVDEHRHHRSRLSDHGKNTLQRSISSPEFQAELIRVAKRVRDKLDSSGTAFDESAHDRRGDRFDAETVGLVDQRSSRRRNEIEDGRENRDDGKERDQRGRSLDSVNVIETGNRETEGGVDRDAIAKSNRRRRTYESPASRDRSANDAVDVVNSCCKSTEGRPWQHQQQNSDPGSRRDDERRSKIVSAKQPPDQKWPDVAIAEKSEARSLGNEYVGETGNSAPNERSEDREHNQSSASTTPKTFYFGMNEGSAAETRAYQDQDIERKFESEVKFLHRDQADGRPSFVADATDDMDDNERNVVENISLKLRPTLPKKQLEIPRFSPSAAWRLLSTLETPGPSMSTASEEIPVLFEERIERLSRPPPPFPLSLGPRSWHDKSGDSGISGDAGAGNEDSFDVSTINRMKTTVTRPTWTPQQDLGEESSSDAGVDSPPPLSTPLKYHSPRAHIFSLSLPRDEARTTTCLYAPETKTREASAFNSLQKLKRSVSGAFGIGSHEHQRKCTRDVLDDNWLLSTSAPTSLQHNRGRIEPARISPSIWQPFPYRDRVARRVQRSRDSDDDDNDDDDDVDDEDEDNNGGVNGIDDDLTEDVDDERESRINQAIDRDAKVKENDFPVILKPPSFSYLMPGGHVMYLPETNETEHRAQHLRSRKIGSTDYAETSTINREQNSEEQGECQAEIAPFRLNAYKNADRNSNIDVDNDDNKEDRVEKAHEHEEEDEEEEEIEEDDDNEYEDEDEDKVGNVSKRRCKRLKSRIGGNDSRGLNELSTCPEPRENVSQPKQRRTFLSSANDDQETRTSNFDAIGESKPQRKNNSRSKRFTFQSTVRQIERRRLAEKLSREAEAKERQRKGELEAMRKVEEEFQRKRAKEKASIRQQLRLFKEMEENFNSLPTPDWDGSQLSRADPDGAPSSTASSPTSLPIGNSSTIAPGKRSIGDSDSTKQLRAERKDYRPKYYDWSPDTCNHLDNHRQTTVHPKIVCDIPKSSHVFVDANVQPGKPPIASNSTPKSDNYRKDFAHGTVATKTSFASSDSELSQSNTRPHSRQNRIKSKPHRPRSGSPVRSVAAATASEEDLSLLVESTRHPRNPTHDFILTGVQPFSKRKTYKPISFNPRPPPPIPS